MKALKFRLCPLLLVLAMLLSLAACNGSPDATSETTSSTGSTSSTETSNHTPKNTFVPSGSYVIVYSESDAGSTALTAAISRLSSALNAVYGISPSRDDDYYRASQGLVPNEYEILIGGTNRAQSQSAIADLRINDYTYLVESEHVIVICGGSISATVSAIDAFCTDVLGYTADEQTCGKQTPIEIGASAIHRAAYPYEQATLNGIPLSEWTIAIGASGTSADLADTVLTELGALTGERVRTVLQRNLTGEEKNLIVLGSIGRELISAGTLAGCLYRVEEDEAGTVLSLTATQNSLDMLKKHFASSLDHTESGKSVSLTLSPEEYLYFDVEEGIDVWILVSEHREVICDGVTYVEQVYQNERGLPFRAYALLLDPKKVDFITGTSNDGYDSALAVENRQNTQQHMEAAVKNGKNVLAGINTNFFDIHGDYHPSGLVIKDGVVIHGPENGGFFALTKDGRIILDNQSSYYDYVNAGTEIAHAVSGNPMLLINGFLTKGANVAENGIHPRSAIGIAEDGTIIIGVIDGRQASHSNGATLARTALWMRSLGAETALNLDGGGSSNLILRDPATNTYTVCNSPSDGYLRKIHTSLLVVLKEE